MSLLFCCGQDGCIAKVIDDNAMNIADAAHLEWSENERRKNGDFPLIREQGEYLMKIYNKNLKPIKIIKLRQK
jgi:hypothetical protein